MYHFVRRRAPGVGRPGSQPPPPPAASPQPASHSVLHAQLQCLFERLVVVLKCVHKRHSACGHERWTCWGWAVLGGSVPQHVLPRSLHMEWRIAHVLNICPVKHDACTDVLLAGPECICCLPTHSGR